MVRRAARVLGYVLASMATLVMVAVLLLVVALRMGPVPIGFAEPVLLHVLNERAGGLEVAFDAPALRWSPQSRSLELEVRDLAIAPPGRPPLLSAPHAAIDVQVEPLLADRRLVIERLVLIEPGLELVRDEEGDFGLLLGGSEVAAVEPQDDGRHGLSRLLAVLFGGTPELRARIEILAFVVEEASLELVDRASGARFAGRGGARLSREEGLLEVALELVQGERPARLDLRVRQPEPESFALELEVRGLDASVLAPVAGRGDVAELALVLDGGLAGSIDAEGRLEPVRFALSAPPQTVRYPRYWPEPLEIEGAEAEGRADPAAGWLALERFALRANGADAEGQGELQLVPEGAEVTVEATIRNLPGRQLVAFWPVTVGEKPRQWLDENLHEGLIEEGRVSLVDRPGEKAETSAEFRFSGAHVTVLPEMPPVIGGTGTGTLTPDELRVSGSAGTIEAIRLDSLILGLAGLRGDDERLTLDAAGSGPVSGLMRLGARLPGKMAPNLPVPPERVEGTGSYRLRLERPLEKDVPPEAMTWRFTGDVRDLAVQGLEDEIDVARGEASFAADRDAVRVQGRAQMNGVPVEIAEWRVMLRDDSRLRRGGTLRARPAVEDLARLGVELPEGFSGALAVELDVREPRQGARVVQAAFDLAPLGIALPRLGIRKPEGEPGSLRARVTGPSEELLLVEDLVLSLSQAEARGALRIDVGRRSLLQLDLDHVALAGSTGALALRPLEGGGYRISLDADRLDLGRLLERDPRVRAQRPGTQPNIPPLDIAIAARELRFHGSVMRDLEGRVLRTAQGWHDGTLSARLASGDRVSVSLTPAAGGPELKVHTRDAGSLLTFVDRNSTYAPGGTFTLEGTIRSEQPRLRVEGKVAVRDYTLRQAPVLAQLLSLASLTGVLNTLQGRGIHFDRARVDYVLEDDLLTLADGRANGSELGFTFAGSVDTAERRVNIEGTIVPAYTINRILGKVPIVGRLLRGEEGVGAFAATYSVTGSLGDPQIFVNPLSLIVPGFIRDLFDLPESQAGSAAPEPSAPFGD